MAVITGTTFNITDKTPGASYTVEVRAVDTSGNEGPGAISTLQMQAGGVNAQGQEAFLVIGDSIAQGSNNTTGPGPTPTAGTAYYWDTASSTIKQIGATDLPNASNGSPWPQFSIDYNTATGKKPVIVPMGVGGSKWVDWAPASTNYTNAKAAANACLTAMGITQLNWIFISLGINDRNSPTASMETEINNVVNALKADFPGVKIGIIMPGVASTLMNEVPKIRGYIKARALSTPDLHIVTQLATFQQWGLYGADGIHPTQAGNNKLGSLVSGYVTATTAHHKMSRSIYSSMFSTLSASQKTAIDTWVRAEMESGNYENITSFNVGLASLPDRKDTLVDWGLLNPLSDEGYLFDNINGMKTNASAATSARMLISSNNNNFKFTDDDVIVGVRTGTFTGPTGAVYLFGNYNTTIYGLARSATGVLNGYGYDATAGLTTTGGLQSNKMYAVGRFGTTKYLYIDGAEIDTETGVTRGGVATAGVGIGYRYSSSKFGFVESEFKYMFYGKQSAINKAALYDNAETLIASF